MSGNLKDFYEEYWQYRKDIGKIHTKQNYYIPERLKVVVSMIPQETRKISVLDVGCGEGTLGLLLKNRHHDFYSVGCDISEHSIELARPFYDKVLVLNIDDENPRDKIELDKFDYIVCVEILEHLMHPDTALIKLKGLLSDDGCMIVSFPNIAWWKYRLKLLRGHFPEESRLYHHAEHLHDFTIYSFKDLLQKANLKIVEIDGEFIPPDWMRRIVPKNFLKKLMRNHVNFFGYQVVIRAKAG